jgi:hypothetical protein
VFVAGLDEAAEVQFLPLQGTELRSSNQQPVILTDELFRLFYEPELLINI